MNYELQALSTGLITVESKGDPPTPVHLSSSRPSRPSIAAPTKEVWVGN